MMVSIGFPEDNRVGRHAISWESLKPGFFWMCCSTDWSDRKYNASSKSEFFPHAGHRARDVRSHLDSKHNVHQQQTSRSTRRHWLAVSTRKSCWASRDAEKAKSIEKNWWRLRDHAKRCRKRRTTAQCNKWWTTTIPVEKLELHSQHYKDLTRSSQQCPFRSSLVTDLTFQNFYHGTSGDVTSSVELKGARMIEKLVGREYGKSISPWVGWESGADEARIHGRWYERDEAWWGHSSGAK